MTKKPNGRFLLTWNPKKDPEISEFFDNIDEGLYSHTIREVIKDYMKQKNSPNHSNKSDLGHVNKTEWVNIVSNKKNADTPNNKDNEDDNNWASFSPTDI